jgi:hypothetical protein
MLCLVVSIERSFAHSDRDFSTIWAASWHQSAKLSRSIAARCEILAFGDSLVKHGVLPRVLEERLGARAFNLAEFNGEAPTSYFLFHRALEAGARPKAVLLDGELLEDNPLIRTRLWPELLSFRELWELACDANDGDFLAIVELSRLLPSAKARYEIRAGVMSALGGNFVSSNVAIYPHLRNWSRNQGAHVAPAHKISGEESGGTPEPQNAHVARTHEVGADHDPIRKMLVETNYWPTTWAPHWLNLKYIDRFLKLANQRNIPVYWLWPPVHPEVQARRAGGGRDAGYARFVQALARKYPNVVVIDGRNAGYASAVMYDATHLNKTGACAYSEALAEILASRPRTGGSIDERWIALRPFQVMPVDVPVEDLEQSIIALKQPVARRKG